jgi:hypothetical protein
MQKIILLLDNRPNGEFPGFAHAAVQSTQVFIVLKSNSRISANVVRNKL